MLRNFKTLKHVSVFILGIFLVFSGCSDDSKNEMLQDDLEKIVSDLMGSYLDTIPDFPGGLAVKLLKGKDEFFAAVGMPNGVNANTRFRPASISKIFTATAILKLHQERKLDLNDPISSFIPGLNEAYIPQSDSLPFGDELTILQLLQHRAGVYDLANDPIPQDVVAHVPYRGQNYLDYIMEEDEAHTFTFDELIQVLVETQLYYFEPGTDYHYSNTGYTILGKIIERVSQQSYKTYVTNQVLAPMGMNNSSIAVLGNDQLIPAPFCPTYAIYEGELIDFTESNMSPHVAEGSLISTPNDLVWFLRPLLRGDGVLNPEALQVMMDYEPTSSNRGYGSGLQFHEEYGYGHNGAHVAYLSSMFYEPKSDITVLAYSNAWDLSNGMDGLIYELQNLVEKVCFEAIDRARED
jgi:D-alanyl-D-alanine carboxypeptidase